MNQTRAAVEVSDGIYAYVQHDGSWWINNTGFFVGRSTVMSVDACSTVERTQAYLREISTVTDLPVTTLLNTHHHGDHTFGNFVFLPATIIGHENVRPGIQRSGTPREVTHFEPVDWGPVQLAPPVVTFADAIELWVDDLRCEMRHVGPAAHTTSDSYIWVAERKLLFSGDLLFNGGTPFVLQGSVVGALAALDELESLNADVIVPGHGPVCGPEVIDEVRRYLQFVVQIADKGMRAGLTPLETAHETDLGEFAGLLDSERIVGNLHRAYADATDGQIGIEIDTVAALDDMVAYNGGRPLTCHA